MIFLKKPWEGGGSYGEHVWFRILSPKKKETSPFSKEADVADSGELDADFGEAGLGNGGNFGSFASQRKGLKLEDFQLLSWEFTHNHHTLFFWEGGGGVFFCKMYSLGILCVVFFFLGGKLTTGWVLIDCRFFVTKVILWNCRSYIDKPKQSRLHFFQPQLPNLFSAIL